LVYSTGIRRKKQVRMVHVYVDCQERRGDEISRNRVNEDIKTRKDRNESNDRTGQLDMCRCTKNQRSQNQMPKLSRERPLLPELKVCDYTELLKTGDAGARTLTSNKFQTRSRL
jgi:hypothetical protein